MPTETQEDKLHSAYELAVRQDVAFATGLFRGDITVGTILESLGEGVVIVNRSGTILLVNRRAEKMFGYQGDEIVGKPHRILVPDRFRAAHEKHLSSFFDEPRIRPMGSGLDLWGCRKDGTEFPIEISLSYLDTAEGRRFVMAFISDITERKEAENNLQERNAELDAFAHTVAHDMKGALTVVMGYSKILEESAHDLPRMTIIESVQNISQTGTKLNQIVDALLLLSSVSREDAPSIPIDMSSPVADAIARLQLEISEKKAEIEVDGNFPTVLGYAPWVEEVWYNYISNALRYGGNPPKIKLGASIGKDGFANFWVEDNGPGLPPEEQTTIFDYGRQDGKRSRGGYGLGLSIVRRILQKLKGHVGVRSGADGGTVFIFSLPLAGK